MATFTFDSGQEAAEFFEDRLRERIESLERNEAERKAEVSE